MAINGRDSLINAIANTSDAFVIDKASLANASAGQLFSLWQATGQPAQGAIPTAPAVATSATAGAITFNNQTSPITNYLGWLTATSSNSAMGLEIHDRVATMGGLSFSATTTQTTNLPIDLQALAPSADRLGATNYSDGQWFLECYADSGGTNANLSISVTYNDGTTGVLNDMVLNGIIRLGRLISLTPLIPVASQGKFIRSINSVILSASKAGAGNFGFTYRRQRTVLPLNLAQKAEVADWAALGCPEIPNNSCLELLLVTSASSTGTLRGQGKIIHA